MKHILMLVNRDASLRVVPISGSSLYLGARPGLPPQRPNCHSVMVVYLAQHESLANPREE
jgi:hypothetical protein